MNAASEYENLVHLLGAHIGAQQDLDAAHEAVRAAERRLLAAAVKLATALPDDAEHVVELPSGPHVVMRGRLGWKVLPAISAREET